MNDIHVTRPYWANIYVGTRVGYTSELVPASVLEKVCEEYCNEGLCVTVTPTQFIYKNGREPGCIVGMINYPRFPVEPIIIQQQAIELARKLKAAARQIRVTIITPDDCLMIGEAD